MTITAGLSRLVELRREVMELGESHRTAAGLGLWLLARAAGEETHTARDTEARYRRILRELPTPPGSDPDETAEQSWIRYIAGGG